MIVLDHSIGGVSYHERESSAEKLLGAGTLIDLGIPGARYVLYARWGLKVLYIHPRALWIAMQIETRSPRYKTAQGVRVGSTMKAVKALPGVTCDSSGVCGRGFAARGSLGTTFQFDRHGRVNWIAVGSTSG